MGLCSQYSSIPLGEQTAHFVSANAPQQLQQSNSAIIVQNRAIDKRTQALRLRRQMYGHAPGPPAL